MKLISIKAHGFKSFADKIEISVDDKITNQIEIRDEDLK